ncbi:unnamed protein product [Sphagnum jensenii]|uniref:Secreted protein n=1 Tax=Sphagnum jensenii TaxID=128206 RepID=A0ABP1BVZ8_9BRYO
MKMKKATATAVAFFVEVRCNAAPQQEEEGDNSCRRLLLPLFLALHKEEEEEGNRSCYRLLHGATAQLHNWKKKAMVVAVAFFVELRCSVAPQLEESNGNCRRLLLCNFLRCTKKKKKKQTLLVELRCNIAYLVQRNSTNKQTK